VPIGGCYAITLWVGNAAYLYLSVSFIQMLKALMPVAVFSVGCFFGTDKFSTGTMANMILVTIGVAIASYGGWQAAEQQRRQAGWPSRFGSGSGQQPQAGAAAAPRLPGCAATQADSSLPHCGACCAVLPSPAPLPCFAVLPAGEINFNITGVMFQMGSIFSESIRLVMVQILLQVRACVVSSWAGGWSWCKSCGRCVRACVRGQQLGGWVVMAQILRQVGGRAGGENGMLF
jgi:hypothetical protein